MQQANPQERFDLPAAGEPRVCEAWISYCLQQNWSIIPLIGGPDVQRGKRPALRWEPFMRQRTAPADLHKRSDLTAYGVVCGQVSQLVVLDLDDADLATRFWQHFPDFMQTFVVQSGTRGTPHIYWSVDFPVKTRHFPNADLKAEGGYVVGPGSQIANAQWQVLVHQPVRPITRAELDEVLRFLRPAPVAETLPDPTLDKRQGFQDFPAIYRSHVQRLSGRNQALFVTTCYMRDAGHTQAQAIQQLADTHARQSAVNSACREPYARRYAEALRTIASVFLSSCPPCAFTENCYRELFA